MLINGLSVGSQEHNGMSNNDSFGSVKKDFLVLLSRRRIRSFVLEF